MSVNQAIAERLDRIAVLLELLGADTFRAVAHARAARTVEGHATDLGAFCGGDPKASKARLTEIPGIGPKIADKIVEFCATGRIAELDELAGKVPPGLLELLKIPGIGPKTIRVFWQEGGVTDLAGLKRIIDSGQILTLPRQGAKAVEKLRAGLTQLEQSGQRMRLGPAAALADAVVAAMAKVKGVREAAYAGSLRRGKETIGDVDILVAADEAAAPAIAKAFTSLPGVVQVITGGPLKCSVRMLIDARSRWDAAPDSVPDGAAPAAEPDGKPAPDAAPSAAAGDAKPSPGSPAGPTTQVDLRVVPPASWGAALMYFTGSKEHNVLLRQRALDRGLTLNEYGLYPEDPSTDEPPQKRGVAPAAGRTEPEIYAALGLPWLPPEIRESRGELALDATPRLLEVADIRSELHAHTTASDGVMSILELARQAKARGFHTIAVTDHSQSQGIAGGLKPARLREHIKAIHAARQEIDGITILAGSEVDILLDGSLDYDDDLLAQLDVVVASPHHALTQEPKGATKRLLKAIRHPLVRVIGHPTGRLVMRRSGLDPDMAELIAAAREHDVALEINAHWMRLDLRDTHVRAAVEAGCLIAVHCDVHHPEDFDNLRFGVATGRRGWLTPDRCINAWTARKLHAWLKRPRA